jgi:murein DD-endopeptidase MepM/ murein hydrolase activator NlpD
VEIPPTSTIAPDAAPILYYAQSGDTLPALAKRFNVAPEEIHASQPLPAKGLIDPGLLLVIPKRIGEATTPDVQLLPDSEIVFSATAAGFDIAGYIRKANGYLNTYREYLGTGGWASSPDLITRLAYENSINPRLLLAVLEYESHWVRGQPIDDLHLDFPLGFQDSRYKNLFMQMVWAVNQISTAYYGWRSGNLTELTFNDGTRLRIAPQLNAGSVAIQYLFSRLHTQAQWTRIIDPASGFPALYAEMFGDPWTRADRVTQIFPAGIRQPPLSLPFEPNTTWSYTGGPHGAWEHDGALAAIDFAPSSDHAGCVESNAWVTAAAAGLVVRSENGVVVLDLDGDNHEETGWNLLYLHIASKDRVQKGVWVEADERIGHPSCEGGVATGTHVHFARKYNGEWVIADGPLPFNLSGWTVVAGEKPYEGLLIKGDRTIIADPLGRAWSVIIRESDGTPTPARP